MNQDDVEDRTTYLVVANHEEQFSIWPDYKEIPAGWRAAGQSGTKRECLEYIGRVWTDMRPLSLRRYMASTEADRAAENPRPEMRNTEH